MKSCAERKINQGGNGVAGQGGGGRGLELGELGGGGWGGGDSDQEFVATTFGGCSHIYVCVTQLLPPDRRGGGGVEDRLV
jgi:hypothetical protein